MWLMRRIRDYAVERKYSRYTSTLEEAWRISITGLTDSIASALLISEEPWELAPDDTFLSDTIAAFGVLEAQKHRSRGITIEMFMGLMKYYRQTFLDVIRIPCPSQPKPLEQPVNEDNTDWSHYALFIERVFDRIEIAFCAEWCRNETMSRAIDELQEANRRMTNEKNKFLTIFESFPLAVYILDDHGHIVHMNHAGEQMLDPTAKSGGHYYSNSDSTIPFPWLKEELSRFHETFDHGGIERMITLPDGSKRMVAAFFRPMEDISFKFPGKVVILKNITERKKTQDKLKQTQAFLVQQEKMASIGQLAAGVAHEINNPMGFVMSNLSCLKDYIDSLIDFIALQDKVIASKNIQKDGQLAEARKTFDIDYISKDAKDLINESLEGTERIKRIVQDLKTFSRVDQSEFTSIDLNESIETTINIAWNEIKYVAKLNREFGDIPRIECYPQQLNQVFLNLLINAAQAIIDKGTITIRTWCNGAFVYVSVSDTGCGITDDTMSRIFEPFFTTKEVGKGTGLGLSISYGIVENHGGKITVESKPGKGSTFTVSIPITMSVEAV